MANYTSVNYDLEQDLLKLPSDTTGLSFDHSFNNPIKVDELPISLKNWFYLRALILKYN